MLNFQEYKKQICAILIVVLLVFFGIATCLRKTGDNRGFAPTQPIPFSHKIHAGDNQIPCQYCHTGADESRHATIPPMNVCMNCHKVVKTESPFIQKMAEMYQKGEPIEWVRVHDLPDHAYFFHKRHIQVGIECYTCHGAVETMDKIKQEKILNMGFCVDCHKTNKAPTDCVVCHQ